MAVYLITRHPGAVEWAKSTGLVFDHTIQHINARTINCGDRVYGLLPVHLAAIVCDLGAEYWHLCIDIPEHKRGQELSIEEMRRFNARFEQFHVQLGQQQS
ncbi:CRISPR-associated protein Csx16 [Endozoicomonas sp. 2B-B]